MGRSSNYHRVVFYGRNDFAVGYHKQRVIDLLLSPNGISVESINDSIEAHQCKLTVDNLPELFESQDLRRLRESAKSFFSQACRFANAKLPCKGLKGLYEEVETQYLHLFWQFLDACGATKRAGEHDLELLLESHPGCLSSILERRWLVDQFGEAIRRVMLRYSRISAELIVGRLATENYAGSEIYLPSSLCNSDIDSIMLEYLAGDERNQNYVDVLKDWPSKSANTYKPSSEVRVFAKRVSTEATKEMFKNGYGIRYGSGVSIDMRQRACKGLERDGLTLHHTFGGQWLETYMDPATILNNLIYVFDYVNPEGIMLMPAHKHEDTALFESLGLHAKDKYRETLASTARSTTALLETVAYAGFLEDHDVRLEDALEWAYNYYFESEYGISGFSLALPSKGGTWLDKCKAVGPEIERALKAYICYSKRGAIEDDYFPYEGVKSFSDISSLNGDKYAIAGPEFEKWGFALFSDQSPLSYLHGLKDYNSCFYEAMLRHELTRHDYPEYLHGAVAQLVEGGFVSEDELTGRILPTPRAVCMRLIWKGGAIALKGYGGADRLVIDELVKCDVLAHCPCLFAPDEASYLNYMFNDAVFSNSLGLRNKYDHAHASVGDPNDGQIKKDYYWLLMLLIAITIKINEELMDHTERGGVEDFIDWPYYDENIIETAMQLFKDEDTSYANSED